MCCQAVKGCLDCDPLTVFFMAPKQSTLAALERKRAAASEVADPPPPAPLARRCKLCKHDSNEEDPVFKG